LKTLSTALKQAKDTIAYVQNQTAVPGQSFVLAASTDVNSWTNLINSHLNSLLSDSDSIASATRNLNSSQASLDQLQAGADPLDIESAQLNLQEAEQTYSNYTFVAPSDGVIGKLNIKVGDNVSSGEVVASLVTPKQEADISLNEVDAAKVKVGDKAVLTFDAVDGLTLTGTLSELDLIGTVSQGVVQYGAKITFDVNDPRVLPGMSVNAEIITDVKTDVLYVPSSAIKTNAQGSSYVQVFNPPISSASTNSPQGVTSVVAPQNQTVVVGSSNDTSTEIVSGLTEGQQIVTRVINPSTTTSSGSQAPSIFGATGANRGIGGAVRVSGVGR
jgi:HlyD family secretion protein